MGMTLELHPSDRHNKAAMALAGGGGGRGHRVTSRATGALDLRSNPALDKGSTTPPHPRPFTHSSRNGHPHPFPLEHNDATVPFFLLELAKKRCSATWSRRWRWPRDAGRRRN